MTFNSVSPISIGSQHISKKKNLKREGDITGLIYVTVQGSRLMEIYAPREDFGFARYAIG